MLFIYAMLTMIHLDNIIFYVHIPRISFYWKLMNVSIELLPSPRRNTVFAGKHLKVGSWEISHCCVMFSPLSSIPQWFRSLHPHTLRDFVHSYANRIYRDSYICLIAFKEDSNSHLTVWLIIFSLHGSFRLLNGAHLFCLASSLFKPYCLIHWCEQRWSLEFKAERH